MFCFVFFPLWRIWIYLFRYLRLLSFEIIIIIIIRRIDGDFQGQYLPSLSIDTERFGKMAANEMQRNEFITYFICSRISLGTRSLFFFPTTSFTGAFSSSSCLDVRCLREIYESVIDIIWDECFVVRTSVKNWTILTFILLPLEGQSTYEIQFYFIVVSFF